MMGASTYSLCDGVIRIKRWPDALLVVVLVITLIRGDAYKKRKMLSVSLKRVLKLC